MLERHKNITRIKNILKARFFLLKPLKILYIFAQNASDDKQGQVRAAMKKKKKKEFFYVLLF